MALSTSVWARGGGGCFEAGTQILTPQGSKAIEQLKTGDQVYSRDHGKLHLAKVVSTMEVQPEHYLVIMLPKREIHVTDEHLIAIERGVFRRAASLAPHDKIIVWHNNQWQTVTVLAIRKQSSKLPAYNLLVDSGSTYLADHVLVHNKGCFLPETPVLRADGSSMSISHIRPGDEVAAYEPTGKIMTTTVQAVIKHEVESYYKVTTKSIVVHVTGEHPFYIGNGTFKTVEALTKGDVIYAYDGEKLSAQQVLGIQEVNAPTTVYNLQTNEPHTYFAAGIAVHNKGGGGGGGRGGGSGGGSCNVGDTWCQMVNVILFITLFGVILFLEVKKRSRDLDYLNSRRNIDNKSIKTLKLLAFLSKQDIMLSPKKLTDRTREVFLLLQQCWTKRNYTPMQDLMMPDLYQQHCKQIAGMIKNHEINKLYDLKLEKIDLVNVRYTEKEYQREFTALITAVVSDFYVDDRTDKFLRGSKFPERFQEFWTFELEPDGWRLRDIEQARESDYLKEENFVEMMTDLQIQKIYGGQKVDKLGVSGPWLPKAVEQKETSVSRMLNFLSKSNKVWERQSIIVRVRSVFTQVHMAFEAGRLDDETKNTLFPDVALQMEDTLNRWKAAGNTIEYRNFCVRKVEIVLVESYYNKHKNEFTARVSAHAQVIHLKNGKVISKDADVSLFVEYWEFGLLDGVWKLKSAKPQSEDDILDAENIEEGSSPNLVKWYYTQKRAL